MKILYIVPYVPYPLNSGGNQAFFAITDRVRKHHDLSVLLYAHNGNDRANIDALKKLWNDVEFYVYDENEKKQENSDEKPFANMSWRDRTSCRLFLSIAQSMYRKIGRRQYRYKNKQEDMVRNRSTLFATSNDLNADFCRYVQETAAKGFDVIQIEFYEYLPLVHLLPKEVKKIFVHHEVRFVRNENELQLFNSQQPTDLILFQREKAFELSCLSAYDAIITLTETDKSILSQYLQPKKIFVSPAVINIASFEQKPFKPATELVFIGSGDHFPNADAMIWFSKEIVPVLQSRMEKIPQLNIVGMWRKDLKENILSIFPQANFTGYIEDLPSFLNGKISVVPVRIGSGMRIKILDTVFASAPLVTTTKGCEGLPMVSRENCLIADDPEGFADAIIEILTDKNLQERLSNNASQAKTGMLNKEELIEKRLSVYEQIENCSLPQESA